MKKIRPDYLYSKSEYDYLLGQFILQYQKITALQKYVIENPDSVYGRSMLDKADKQLSKIEYKMNVMLEAEKRYSDNSNASNKEEQEVE